MPLAIVAENYALDQLGTSKLLYASLHTAYSATGANEVTGGSPAYARKVLAWAGASGGGKNLSGNAVFDVPGGGTIVSWVGYWDALTLGNFQGMAAAGSAAPLAYTAVAATDVLTAPGSALANGATVVVLPGVGAVLPAGLTVGTVYFVVNAAGATFKLSLTLGGGAVDITADGAGIVQPLTVDSFPAQGTYTLTNPSSGSLFSLV